MKNKHANVEKKMVIDVNRSEMKESDRHAGDFSRHCDAAINK